MAPSKWEWIAEKLEELGEVDLAAKAKEIETVLKCIYGDTETIAWLAEGNNMESRYRSLDNIHDKLTLLETIDMNANYCIACMTDKKCRDCRFGKIAGKCFEPNSLFKRFYKNLYSKMIDILDRDLNKQSN